MTTTIRTWKQLFAAAADQGYRTERGPILDLISCGDTNRSVTVVRYEDGTIVRADVDLTLTKRMTVAEAVAALGVLDITD